MSLEKLNEALKDLEVVELGTVFEEQMPHHPLHSGFYKMLWQDYALGDSCRSYQLIVHEHNGTHVDSFGHFINEPGFEMIDKVPLSRLCGPCITVDATGLNEYEGLEEDAIRKWEAENSEIQEGDVVLLDFGWMRYWNTRPDELKFSHKYPGLGESGAKYLAAKGVRAVGLDTMSVDADLAPGDPAHHILLGNRIPIIENLCNLDKMHGKRGYFIVLPLLIKDGSASPVRPIALIEK